MRPLRICIDARIISGEHGGIEQVVIGIASGLATLTDGDEEYLYLTWKGQEDWIRPHIGRGRIITVPTPTIPQRIYAHLTGRYLRRRIYERLPYIEGITGHIPRSDGFIEHLGVDVMHFTYQGAFLTKVPSLFHPHDLQHVHLPQFFSAHERERREVWYATLCRQARLVPVASEWTRRDVMDHFGLPPDKVQVVKFPATTRAYVRPADADIERVRSRLKLPGEFIFYPAQTWPHKNHIRLLEAMALLRDRDGLTVNLVCSGRRSDFFETIQRRIRELKLENQTVFVDFVDPLALQSIYLLARAVVVPTLFEAGSGPMKEAFELGVASACSNVTSLPGQVGDGALVFDPTDVPAMADAVRRLWTDDALRRQLIERGRQQIGHLTWADAAREFRRHYRRIAGRSES